MNEEDIKKIKEKYKYLEENNDDKGVTKRVYLSFNFRVFIFGIFIFIFLVGVIFCYSNVYLLSKDKVVDYDEVSDITYNVCLDDNKIYSDPCLKEGMEYVNKLTKNVNARFSYEANMSSNINYDLSYNIIATTKIYSDKERNKVLYEEEDNIVPSKNLSGEGNRIYINQMVELDYKKYYNMVHNYILTYAKEAIADVTLTFYINDTDEKEISSLVIPLSGETYNIDKNIISYKNQSFEMNNNRWNEVTLSYAIIGTICLLFLIILIACLTRLIIKSISKKNKFQAELTRLMREYDRYIVIARDGYESNIERNVIKVTSFKELLDARNTLNKPIIYSKVNNVKSEFIVEDEMTLYKYVMKEADFK